MEKNLKKEMIKCIEASRGAVKNNMEISLDCYGELISRLDMLTYLILCDNVKDF